MNYFFIGIGGIGMSAIARYLHLRGDQVSGYDLTPSPLTAALEKEGIEVFYEDNPELMPKNVECFVYTPAVPRDTAVFKWAEGSGRLMLKRSQMLGQLTDGKKCIAVAGTHGKTSTSTMIAHLLSKSKLGCSAFLGGISKNFQSNIVVDNKSDFVVVEADEYDRSFLQLHPYYSVITSIDPDHLDIYGDYDHLREAFLQFANQTKSDGKLFLKQGVAFSDGEEHEHEGHEHEGHGHNLSEGVSVPIISYTTSGIEADYYAWNVRTSRGNIYYDLRTPKGVIYDIELHHTSLYNVENSVVAAAVALECGLDEFELRAGLKSYEGVCRRFDFRVETKDVVYIDDYAHHPKEIAATLDSIRFLYPGKRIVGVFQPHLYSRTADFADQFAEVLSTLDEAVLLPIYPAREKPMPGVSSGMILRKMDTLSKYLVTKEQLMELIPALYPDILVTLGAGDIDRLVPQIEKLLTTE
ncbi:MAG: UDP-N-acetylmuramate--L-alanine ligase [Bacteroidales bacterium]|nr:UDP-N-acetylmuramate--L-alanine ligase [Bacteroidales bacterium]